jgi:WD40 repeat protein
MAELPPPRSRLILERVLGLTALSNAMAAVNPVSGELAYAAGCIVVVYNLRRNKQVRYYRVDKSVACLSFSPNGQFLAIGEKGYLPAITIWDGTDGTLCAELQRHQYGVACMAFSQDGRFLLSAGLVHDQHVYAWELKPKRRDSPRRLEVAAVGCALVEDKILDADFCQAGNFFVTVGEKHFKVSTGWNACVFLLTWPVDARQYWFLDESGSFLVTGLQVNELPELQHRDAVVNAKTSATFTGVGCGYGSCELKTFAVTADGTLCCFGASGIMERLVSLESTSGNAISVTESYVAVGGSSGVLRLFNPSTLEYRTTLPFPPEFGAANDPSKLAPAPTSVLYPADPFRYPAVIATRITGSHVIVFYSDRSIFIYGATNPDAVTIERSFLYHSGGVRDLQVAGFTRGVNAKGRLVYGDNGSSGLVPADTIPSGTFVTCSDDNTVRLWNLELHRRPVKSNRFEANDAAGRAEHECWKNPYSQELLRVIYNDHADDFEDEHCVVLGGTCSHESSNSVHSPPKTHGRNKGLRALAVRPDQREIAAGDQEGNVVVIPVPLEKPVIRIGAHSAKVNCLAYSRRTPSGSILMASGGKDRLIQLYDCDRGHVVLSTLESHSAAVTAVSLSCDGRALLSCGEDDAVSVSGIDAKGDVISSNRVLLAGGKVFDAMLLPDNDTVLASCNTKLEIMSASTGQHKQTHLIGEQHHIAVCPANYCVAMSGSLAERTIHVVDITTGETLATGTGHGEVVTALAFTPDCRRLLSASSDGCVFVWRLGDDIQAEIKTRLPRVTETQWTAPAPPVEQEEAVLPPPAPPKSGFAQLQVDKETDAETPEDVSSLGKNPLIPKWKGRGVAVPGPTADIPMEEWMRTRTTAIPTIHVVDGTEAPASSAVSASPLKDQFMNLTIETLDVDAKSSTSLALEREQLEKRKKQRDTVNAVAAMNTRLSQLGLLRPAPKVPPSRLKSPSPLKVQQAEERVEAEQDEPVANPLIPARDSRSIPPPVVKFTAANSNANKARVPETQSSSPSDASTGAQALAMNSAAADIKTVKEPTHLTKRPAPDSDTAAFKASKPVVSRGEDAGKVADDLVSQALRTLNSEEPPRPSPMGVDVAASLSMHTSGYDKTNSDGDWDDDESQPNVAPQPEVDVSLSSFTSGFGGPSQVSGVASSDPVASSLSAFTAGYGADTKVANAVVPSHVKTSESEGLLHQIPVDMSLSGFVSGYGKDADDADSTEAVQPPSVAHVNGTRNPGRPVCDLLGN